MVSLSYSPQVQYKPSYKRRKKKQYWGIYQLGCRCKKWNLIVHWSSFLHNLFTALHSCFNSFEKESYRLWPWKRKKYALYWYHLRTLIATRKLWCMHNLSSELHRFFLLHGFLFFLYGRPWFSLWRGCIFFPFQYVTVAFCFVYYKDKKSDKVFTWFSNTVSFFVFLYFFNAAFFFLLILDSCCSDYGASGQRCQDQIFLKNKIKISEFPRKGTFYYNL